MAGVSQSMRMYSPSAPEPFCRWPSISTRRPAGGAIGFAGGHAPAGSQFHFVIGGGHFGGDGPGGGVLQIGEFIETGAAQAPARA